MTKERFTAICIEEGFTEPHKIETLWETRDSDYDREDLEEINNDLLRFTVNQIKSLPIFLKENPRAN